MSNNIIAVDGVPTLVVNDPNALNDYLLIDVRRPDEFTGELGHIDGAKLVTLGPDLEAFLETTEKESSILFICRSGARSAHSTLAAQSMGFTKVYNMDGGMIQWNEKKFPVTR